MAGEEENRVTAIRPTDDTRQDTPLEAFPEAHSPHPGRQRDDDTRQDPPPEAEPAHLCGRRVGRGSDTRQVRNSPRSGLRSLSPSSEEREDGLRDHASGQTALRGGETEPTTDCNPIGNLPQDGITDSPGRQSEETLTGDHLETL